MPDQNLERLVHKNLMYTLSVIEHTELFKHIFVRDKRTGQEFDALSGGTNSCAFTVTGVLALHGLIDHPHATVATTLETMQQAGWVETTNPQPGDVVLWPNNQEYTQHIAFYIGENQVIGNATSSRAVKKYPLTLPDGRSPSAYFTHPLLRAK